LFGIHCGHFGFPVHEKAFYPSASIVSTDEDNDEQKLVAEERERKWAVRESEIRAEAFEAAGDKEFAEIYAKKARQAAGELEVWRRILTKSRRNVKIGNRDGKNELVRITRVNINNDTAVNTEFNQFANEFRNADIEHSLDISPNGNAYLVRGGNGTVNSANLIGKENLIGSIGIHNHPPWDGFKTSDSFSYMDLLDAAKYQKGIQFLVSGERRNAFLLTEAVTAEEITIAWIEAENAVYGNPVNDYDLMFKQESILKELGRHLRGFKFYEDI
jgi:hypothetical protein